MVWVTSLARNNFDKAIKVDKGMLKKFFLAGLLLMSLLANAELYKWVDENGRTHFSDTRPEQQSVEQIEVKEINSLPTVQVREWKSPTKTASGKRKKVVMYSTTWCRVCKKAKAYFQQNKIPFKEYDVETSEKGKRDYEKLKGRGVPIVLIGKHRMDGFSASRFKGLYQP